MGKNRSIQQKILKMKRRNRHAVFSGDTSKFMTRDVVKLEYPLDPNTGKVEQDKVRLKRFAVPVGPISLSKAVINTGRGPDAVRMQEYYQRVHSYDQALPDTIGAVSIDHLKSQRRSEGGLRLKDFDLGQKYTEFIKGTPKEMRICLFEDDLARLDLYFNITQWFFVEANYVRGSLRRSTIYKSRDVAMALFKMDKITWVETLSSSK